MANRIQNVDSADSVGGEGGEGVLVAGDDEGLGRQVENDLGLVGGEDGAERGRVPYIPSHIHNPLPSPRQGEHIRFSGWFQAKSHYIRAEELQPVCEPGTFEASVTGDENRFVVVDLSERRKHKSS